MKRGILQFIPLALVVLLVLGVVFARSILYTVNERELAVVLQFGEPVDVHTEPGLYFKVPFIQEVRRLPKTLQFWRNQNPVVDLPTKDGKKIEVDAWAVWRITDPGKFVRVLRTVENAEDAVRIRVRAAIRDVITSHDLSEVVRNTNRELTYSFKFVTPEMKQLSKEAASAVDIPLPVDQAEPSANNPISVGREKILELVKEKVIAQLKGTKDGQEAGRGIELVDVGISNIGFVPLVREAAFDRQKAFMESIAAGYLNLGELRRQEILNKTMADVERIQGEGEGKSRETRGKVDAEIIAEYAKAIQEKGDFYNFIRTLEVYKNSLSGQTRLILTTDSELFRLLKQVNPHDTKMQTGVTNKRGPGERRQF